MKEEEIRPQAIFDEYLALAKKDTEKYFLNAPHSAIACPACGKPGINEFIKSSFQYQRCPDCSTLFVSPRPEKAAFDKYYTESDSARYWASTFYKETAEARREKLWKPKAELLNQLLAKYSKSEIAVVDIGGGYGIFAEEMAKLTQRKICIIEPGPELAQICRNKGFQVIQKFLENVESVDLPSGARAFVSFELFEHLHDPSYFLERLKSLMNKGDIFIFTTLSGTGVDIMTLWQNSKSVSPPHHLNFFNPYSTRILFENNGFDVLEVTTPGKLDIDIMRNNIQHIQDRFWQTVLKQSTSDELARWQHWIADNGWSSHMMVTSQKR